MWGRGAKGSVRDRLIQNRFFQIYKKRKLKKQRWFREKRQKQMMEVQKRLAVRHIHLESLEILLPKKYRLIRTNWTLDSSNMVLSNGSSMKHKKGEALKKDDTEQFLLLEAQKDHIIQKTKTLREEALKISNDQKIMDEIYREVQTIRMMEKDLEVEYDAFLKKYPDVSKKKALFSVKIWGLCDEIEEILKKKHEEDVDKNVESKQSMDSVLGSESLKKEEPLVEHLEEKSIPVEEAKRVAPTILGLTVYSSLVWKDRMKIEKQRVQFVLHGLEQKLKGQRDLMNGMQQKIGQVQLTITAKEKKTSGLFGSLKCAFQKAIWLLFTPFTVSQRRVFYRKIKGLNSDVRKMRKIVTPAQQICLYDPDYMQEIVSLNDSFEHLRMLTQDTLKQVDALIHECLETEFFEEKENSMIQELEVLKKIIEQKEQEIELCSKQMKSIVVAPKEKVKEKVWK